MQGLFAKLRVKLVYFETKFFPWVEFIMAQSETIFFACSSNTTRQKSDFLETAWTQNLRPSLQRGRQPRHLTAE